MKKIIALMLALVLCIGMLAGCNRNGGEDTNGTEGTSEPTEQTEKEKSELEKKLDEYFAGVTTEKVNFEAITVSYNGNFADATVSQGDCGRER